MKKEYLLLNTITNALRAQEILRRNGFQAPLTRLPKNIVGRGCGYCLLVSRDPERAVKVLHDAGIKLYGTYSSEG